MFTQIIKPVVSAGMVALAMFSVGAAQSATPYVSTVVEGALSPGVYGRIEIGNAPPPPLIYAQPIVVYRPPVVVQQQPLYLHVPPGHAKKWSKHCDKYNACGQPVYFVKVKGDDEYERYGQKEFKEKKDKKHGKNKHDD